MLLEACGSKSDEEIPLKMMSEAEIFFNVYNDVKYKGNICITALGDVISLTWLKGYL